MKKILLALALCLVLVGLTVSPAFATTTKAPLLKVIGYDPGGGGDVTETPIFQPGSEP